MKCSCGSKKMCDVWGMFKSDNHEGLRLHFGPSFEENRAFVKWREQRQGKKKIDKPRKPTV